MLLIACSEPSESHQVERSVEGGCEDCELMQEGMPAKILWETTIAGPAQPGERVTLGGTVYAKEGRTPVPGIILYAYHTDHTGHYTPGEGQTAGRRHGHLRGWVRSDAHGRYRFNTIRPTAYPSGQDPQHIHVLVKEPGVSTYWIDNIVFDDDPLLTQEERSRPHRGGNGVVTLQRTPEGWVGERDIVLGLNIVGYP